MALFRAPHKPHSAKKRLFLDRILISPFHTHKKSFCSLQASLVCVYPISLICQHSVSLNVGSRSFHVNIMKAAAVHHLLPSQQHQANTSVSKNGNYSGTIPRSHTMEEAEPPETHEAGGNLNPGQVLVRAKILGFRLCSCFFILFFF